MIYGSFWLFIHHKLFQQSLKRLASFAGPKADDDGQIGAAQLVSSALSLSLWLVQERA